MLINGGGSGFAITKVTSGQETAPAAGAGARRYATKSEWIRRTWSRITFFPTSLDTAAVQPVRRHSFATCSLTDSIGRRLAVQAEVEVKVILMGRVGTWSEDRGEIAAGRRPQCADQIA